MEISKISNEFMVDGSTIGYKLLNGGNINLTYVVEYLSGNATKAYVLQRINMQVFKNPDLVMQNVVAITEYIGSVNPDYPLKCIRTKGGGYYFVDDQGEFWRMYNFVKNSTSFDTTDNLSVALNTGLAFGKFQNYLNEFEATKLNVTIKDFHNTKLRVKSLIDAVKFDEFSRRRYAESEIEYIINNQNRAVTLCDLLIANKLPLKVTHNDTKCNNVLFDKDTLKPLAVVDLDTVMPGLCAHDYGDGIRSIASTAKEDEENLSLVDFDFDKFKAFTKGFVSQIKHNLTETELSTLYLGIEVMTLELATRFLCDYLQGDIYFKTEKPLHNLIRAKNQIELSKKIAFHRSEIMQFISNI